MGDLFLEGRINIFCVKLGKIAGDTCAMFSEVYGGETMKSQVFLCAINGSKRVMSTERQRSSLSSTSRVQFTLNSFHKAKQSTELNSIWKCYSSYV
jgi:hypothetical protein